MRNPKHYYKQKLKTSQDGLYPSCREGEDTQLERIPVLVTSLAAGTKVSHC